MPKHIQRQATRQRADFAGSLRDGSYLRQGGVAKALWCSRHHGAFRSYPWRKSDPAKWSTHSVADPKTGPVGDRLMRGMRHAIAAMAQQGNDMIVDDVLLGNEKAAYRRLLADFELFTVGVFAPLELLEARERQRGDRLIGLARWQFDRVHADMTYDLELDTSTATPLDCARRIVQAFGL